MLYMNNRSYLMSCLMFVILVASLPTFSAYGASSSPSIFSKGDKPYGISYEDWMTKWWQWNIQIPKQQHPGVVQSNLIKCPVGESGSVSFLTHSLQGESKYSCTVQAGHAIMIPISTGECTSDEAKSSVPADMLKCASEGDRYLHLDATVDGVRLNVLASPVAAANGLDQNYTISKVFDMPVPKDNLLDLKPGIWKTVTGGYFVFLKPLPAGDHNVSISARVTNPIDASFNYSYHTQFLLKVL
jgi:hypothetical protein